MLMRSLISTETLASRFSELVRDLLIEIPFQKTSTTSTNLTFDH